MTQKRRSILPTGQTPANTSSNRVGDTTEVKILTEKVTQKVLQDSKKAGTILSEWLRRPAQKKAEKKKAA